MATDQSEALKRIGENLYVNGHGIYFAWFSLRGKQIKRSSQGQQRDARAMGRGMSAVVEGVNPRRAWRQPIVPRKARDYKNWAGGSLLFRMEWRAEAPAMRLESASCVGTIRLLRGGDRQALGRPAFHRKLRNPRQDAFLDRLPVSAERAVPIPCKPISSLAGLTASPGLAGRRGRAASAC